MTLDPSQIKVALLMGGTSGEREISLASGAVVQKELKKAGFSAEKIDPIKKKELVRLFTEDFDVAFICLHGKGGEDGAIQGLLELAGIPYVGSGILSSASALDKKRAKLLYQMAGLPIVPGFSLAKDTLSQLDEKRKNLRFPCVVKPATEGSSLGLRIVKEEKDLDEAIQYVLTIDDSIIVEQFIQGTEATVAVIGNTEPEALPVIEIVPLAASVYDFESKYAEGGCKHIIPARLDKAVLDNLQDLAKRAHACLGCRGMSRTDFIVDSNNKCWILETNTIPGMTGTSLLPDTAQKAGHSYPELCTKLIEFALEQDK